MKTQVESTTTITGVTLTLSKQEACHLRSVLYSVASAEGTRLAFALYPAEKVLLNEAHKQLAKATTP